MDRTTVFTKTAKGLMEATGKTSALSRDMRAILKAIDGKVTVGEMPNRLGKMTEAKLTEALNVLVKDDFIREFAQMAQPAAAPTAGPAADADMDLDFSVGIAASSPVAKPADDAAKRRAQAAAAAEATARARMEAEGRARAAAEVAAKAKTEAEARARAEAEARARTEAEAKAKAEAEARERAEARTKAEEQARLEAEARARKEAEERARVEAELNARLEAERQAREEAERKAREQAARERKEAEDKARREAEELRAKLEEERRAREDAERRAKDEAERKAREDAEREARELAERKEAEDRAKAEAERKLAEDRAKAEAERRDKEHAGRKETEQDARREADELRAKLEQERKAREDAERRAREAAERKASEDAEREARARLERREQELVERREREHVERREKEHAERRDKEHAERRDKEHAERVARESEESKRRDAEDQTRREAEVVARKEAEDRSRREAEERAQKDAQAKREADEKARKEAEETARREAGRQTPPQPALDPGASLDDLVKIDTDFDAVLHGTGESKPEAARRPAGADDEILKAAEEKTRKEAEAEAARRAEQRRKEEEALELQRAEQRARAESTARREPLTREQEHAEMQARLRTEHEETERHFAEMEKELEAEKTAAKVEQKKATEPRQDAPKREEKKTAAAPEAAPVAYRRPVKWGKPVALALFLFLALGLAAVHLISFDGQIPQFEKLAGAYLQQPVKIKSAHLSLVPLPHWRLDGVSVGREGELEVAQVKAVAELGSMFGDRKAFKSIELESPVLNEQGLAALLFGKPQGQDLKVASVVVRNGKLNSKSIVLPALDARIAIGADGAWQKIAIETPDRKTSVLLEQKGEGAQLEAETGAFSLPFSPAVALENFSAKGIVGRNELRLSEFKGRIYDGYVSGTASLKWGADWSLSGEISARAMEAGIMVPALAEGGKLEGKAVYAMRAKSYEELFAAPRLEGSFGVQKGALLGVDIARLLQGGGIGGRTAFTELAGSFVRDGGRTQLRQVHLTSGPVSASGSADVDAGKNISGRFAAEIKSPVANARANFTVSGSVKDPRFSR